ncbi:MAG: Clp protease ClpC [Candidatus Marinimicrobia bacterium]|nr:Clp protease ClpC [Candidatus Neomarinimicrobiota bacterium]
MKENFSERVQSIIKQSKEEAIELGHSYVGSEHILLGLLKINSGKGKKILKMFNVDINEMINSINTRIKTSGGTLNLGHLPLTRRAERILRNSFNEASIRGDSISDDEHLLLAMLKEPEGVASKVLKSFSLDYETVSDLILSEEGSQIVGELDNDKKIKDNSKTPTLDHFSQDITELARKSKLDPIIGRNEEIERVAQILLRRKKNNPALIGEPGVGKTAIIEGLAQNIINKTLPRVLHNKRILSLDIASIVSGTKYRGQFEERMKSLMSELKKSRNTIIFIDEIHSIVGAGGSTGSLDASNMVKPSLARGEIHCIGATTMDEYRKQIEKDGALDRRFQKVIINPPSVKESIKILYGLKGKYQNYHKVRYTDSAIRACVNLSQRYIADRYLPDKAIDILDEAGARARMFNFVVPKKILKIEEQLKKLKTEKEKKVSQQLFEDAAILRDKEKKLSKKFSEAQNSWQKEDEKAFLEIDESKIEDIVSSMTGVPISKVSKSEKNKILNLDKELNKLIVGQELAINSISNAIKRSKSGLKNPNRPIGVFLFLGPTGVGKTQSAKSLAKYLFPNASSLIRIDMSEFSERFSLSRLIGAPPGYVGYDEGGELTEKVRRNPYSVVLFDEIEKGHPDIYNILLQVFDEGLLTDGLGRKIDFKNTILIMTSNIGTRTLHANNFGFYRDKGSKENSTTKENILKSMKDFFSPELLNRFDETIVFNSLTKADIYKIIDLQLVDLVKNLSDIGLKIKIYKSAKNLILEKGYSIDFGVRFLRRTIQTMLEDPISNLILKNNILKGEVLIVKSVKGEININLKSDLL